MKKNLLLLSALLFAGFTAMGQSITTKDIQIGNSKAPAFTVTIEKNVDLVEDAMEKRLKEAGLKTKKVEGYLAALDQFFAEISSDPINLYTKVEKKSKNATTVTVCANPTNLADNREAIQGNVSRFLANFIQFVDKFDAQQKMEEHQSNLKKAQKQHASAVGVVEKHDKNIQKAQEKIAEKKQEIEKYKAKIAALQEDIKDLEASIAKSSDKKADAQKDVDEAHKNVKSVEGEVEKYRSLSE